MKTLIFFLAVIFCSCSSPKYYDGEGNPIPDHVVSLLVKSQFVVMTAKEDSTINKYFYFRKLVK
jgi:hypothetical protein